MRNTTQNRQNPHRNVYKRLLMLICFMTTIMIYTSAAFAAQTKIRRIKFPKEKSAYTEANVVFTVKTAGTSKNKILWKTSNAKVAALKNIRGTKCKVSFISPGKATITCYIKGREKTTAARCRITVRECETKLKSMSFSKKSVVLYTGSKYKCKLKTDPVKIKQKQLEFDSTNDSVATVNADGTVTTKKPGVTYISARAVDGSRLRRRYKVEVKLKITKDSAYFIAHRGYSSEAPENTIKAFELAGKAGFWGAETDVRVTADGRFILLHDPTFQRVCGDGRAPENMTFNEVRGLKITNGSNWSKLKNDSSATTIPTLEEYLNVCLAYNMVPIIELKGNYFENRETAKKLYDLVASIMGGRQYVYISDNYINLINVKELTPADKTNQIGFHFLRNEVDSFMENICSKYGFVYGVNYESIPFSTIKALRKTSDVSMWTINDRDEAEELIYNGVKYITTEYVLWQTK